MNLTASPTPIRPAQGFTLIEIIIATALIMILLGAFLQLLTSQARVASEESQDTTAQSGLIMTIQAMLPYLEEGRLVDGEIGRIATNPLSVRFYTPMKDVLGRVQTIVSADTGKTEFLLGAGEPGNMTLAHYYELAFVPAFDAVNNTGRADELVREATVVRSTGALGVDLNSDGDTTDSYMFGTMRLRRLNAAGVLVNERMLGGRIAVRWPDGGIFSVNTTDLTLRLTTLDMRPKGEESRIRTTRTGVRLRGDGVFR